MKWSLFQVSPDIIQNKLTITFQADNLSMIHINNIPFDPPGDVKESELKAAATQKAEEVLQDLLANLPNT